MKKTIVFLFLFFISYITVSQVTVCSWNLENFGKSKSDSIIDYIANIIKGFDVIAIEEVVAGDGGAQAVGRLSDALNRKGAKWDYTISDATISSKFGTERYAFIWKTNKLTKIGDAWLDKKHQSEIEREPYFITFKSNGKLFTLVAFHAIPKSKQPETEIKYFKFYPTEYPDKNIIFCGDFNCPQSHTVFNPLKSMGYKPIFVGQKTSLKERCINGDCLASELDNLFFNSNKITYIKSGVIPFYSNYRSLEKARSVSDHLPIYFQFSIN